MMSQFVAQPGSSEAQSLCLAGIDWPRLPSQLAVKEVEIENLIPTNSHLRNLNEMLLHVSGSSKLTA
jgi:hypothetical protein